MGSAYAAGLCAVAQARAPWEGLQGRIRAAGRAGEALLALFCACWGLVLYHAAASALGLWTFVGCPEERFLQEQVRGLLCASTVLSIPALPGILAFGFVGWESREKLPAKTPFEAVSARLSALQALLLGARKAPSPAASSAPSSLLGEPGASRQSGLRWWTAAPEVAAVGHAWPAAWDPNHTTHVFGRKTEPA